MRNVSLPIAVSVLVALASPIGCGSSESAPAPQASGSASGKASASAPPKASTAAAATSTPPVATAEPPKTIELDKETERLLRAIVAACKIGDDASIGDCPKGEAQELGKYAKEKQPKNFHLTLAELALTEGKKDTKLAAAAMNSLSNYVVAGGVDWLKANATPEAATRVLQLIETAPDSYSFYFGSAVDVPLAAGKFAETTAALRKAASSSLRWSGFNAYLDYGGIAALPEVQTLAKDATLKPSERASLISGVGRAVYPGLFGSDPVLPDADKTTACDWAKTYLSDADPKLANAAADSMGRCRGAYVDAALEALGPRLEKEKVDTELVASVYHQCWAEGVVGGAVNGTPDQCKKTLDLVEKALGVKDLETSTVRWAVMVVGWLGESQADNVKKAQSILGKYVGNKEKSVAEAAKEGLDKLKKK
ncbi:MAG: hypothetical protein U0271_15135 [Polyangiaceae bacterium]